MSRLIAVADCETDPFKHGRIPKPFIWGYYDGDDYHEFYDTDSFVEFVKEIPCIVYAHNGGKFDWHYVLDHVEEFEPIMVINGRLSKFKIGEAEFRDSFNILPFKLADYKKDDMNYEIMEESERHKPHNFAKIQSYLKGDCVYLHELIKQFIDDYGMNLTFASASMKQWQKLSGIKPPKCNESFFDRIAPYYYGGRVECFQSGVFNHEFQVIDINSAYPHAMVNHHPYGTEFTIDNRLPKTDSEKQRCFIKLRCISKGAFPLRTKNGLRFPDDGILREYSVTGWEYLAAKRTGTITNVHIIECLSFFETINFEQYITHFFKLKTEAKENGDKAGYLFAKFFLNSLYGKYGSNPSKYKEYITLDKQFIMAAMETDNYAYCADFGTLALCSKPLDEDKRRYFNPAVAASITGFVRAYMWESILKCKGVMYCDTDSIVCSSTGNLELDPTLLGAWDIEATCSEGAIAGKKLYAFKTDKGDYKIASKGGILTADQIYCIANGGEVIYKSDAPTYSLKNGIKFVDKRLVATV